MAKAEKNLETIFKELDDIIIKLEQGDIPLEDSFRLYNDGMKLVKKCNDSIDKVEKKLVVLSERE